MDLYNYTDAGLMTDGQADALSPERWLAWHFTPFEYLSDILASGGLLSDDVLGIRPGSVADPGIKEARSRRIVAAPGYAMGRSVSSHVPFYFAAKSPMLFRVKRNFPKSRIDSLLFLGVRVGDVFDSDLDWVASNGNAASVLAQFSSDATSLGTFVDFPLLTSKWWNDTADDPHRKHRRAAELLVHDHFPFSLVSAIAASNEQLANAALRMIDAAGYATGDLNLIDSMTFLKD